MRTTKRLQQEITATDLSLRYLKAEVHGLVRSNIMLKLALGADLEPWERIALDNMNDVDRAMIKLKADQLRFPTVHLPSETSNPAPDAVVTQLRTRSKAVHPSSQPRLKAVEKRTTRWTVREDQRLMRLHNKGISVNTIADLLGRTPKAVSLRIYKHKKEA